MRSYVRSCCSQMLPNMLLENIHVHRLNVLNFVDNVVPDSVTALVNAN